jgi:hypothetical protein
MKESTLSDNNDLVEGWLKEQPNPIEVHREYDYNFVKKQLQLYLDPNAAAEATPAPAAAAPAAPAANYATETVTAEAKDTVSKFDDLFNE